MPHGRQAAVPACTACQQHLLHLGAASCRPAVRQLPGSCGHRRARQGAGPSLPLRRVVITRATSRQEGEQGAPDAAYKLLQVPRGSSRRQIRAAYIERIKLLHPDVSSSGEESTAEAAAVNAAYERIMAGFGSNSREDDDDEGWDPLEVFDLPEAEPDQLFVNPFACSRVSALQWEDLQEAAREAEAAGRDPWLSLQQQGVQCSEAAFVYLSPQQLALVRQELERACAAMDATSMEAAAYFVSDCLLRARVANNRVPAGSTRWD